MDVIYNIRQTGANIILTYYVISIDSPYFLGVLTGAKGESKTALIPNTECGNVYELTITGVAAAYEDLDNGNINFSSLGTWSIALYYQSSSSNTDPSLATLLETFKLQVNGES